MQKEPLISVFSVCILKGSKRRKNKYPKPTPELVLMVYHMFVHLTHTASCDIEHKKLNKSCVCELHIKIEDNIITKKYVVFWKKMRERRKICEEVIGLLMESWI